MKRKDARSGHCFKRKTKKQIEEKLKNINYEKYEYEQEEIKELNKMLKKCQRSD